MLQAMEQYHFQSIWWTPSSETQARSVGSGKTAVKFFKSGRERWMLLLRNKFHDSFEVSTYRAPFVISLYEGVYLQTGLFTVPVWLAAGELSSKRVFIANGTQKTDEFP